MEHRAWIIFAGALEEGETFSSSALRDTWAEAMVNELRTNYPDSEDWQVFKADVTEGCAVGEYAGEHAVLVGSNEDSPKQPEPITINTYGAGHREYIHEQLLLAAEHIGSATKGLERMQDVLTFVAAQIES